MKLSKLYTNQPNFKNIEFNSGFNVIYADVKTNDRWGKDLLRIVPDWQSLHLKVFAVSVKIKNFQNPQPGH